MNFGRFATKSKAAVARSARFPGPRAAGDSSAGLQACGQMGRGPNLRLRSRGPGCCAPIPGGTMPCSHPSVIKKTYSAVLP